MINIDDYNFHYNLFLAEQELFSELTSNIDYKYDIINESARDTIMNYITKITGQIQEAWNKLKEVISKSINGLSKDIPQRLKNFDPKFTISNCPKYDINTLRNLRLKQFKLDDVRGIKTEKEYINKNFPQLKINRNESIDTAVQNTIVSNQGDIKPTQETIAEMYNQVINAQTQLVSDITDDLEVFNNNNNAVVRAVETTTTSVTTANESYYYSYYNEADNNNPAVGPRLSATTTGSTRNGSTAVEFKDDSGSTQNKDNAQIVNSCTIFLKVSTEILAARMKVYKQLIDFNTRTLRHCFNPATEKAQKQEQELDNAVTNNGNEQNLVAQVNT